MTEEQMIELAKEIFPTTGRETNESLLFSLLLRFGKKIYIQGFEDGERAEKTIAEINARGQE